MIYFGNLHGGDVMIDAKPIPGTDQVACIFSPGHGQPVPLVGRGREAPAN